MNRIKRFFDKKMVRVSALLIVVVIFITLTARKIYNYAAAPDKEKDCNFTFPTNPDQTKSTTIFIKIPEQTIPFVQKGGFINDASCLNKTAVHGIVDVAKIEDIQNALQFAQKNNLQVTSAGQRHSMGGQSFVQGGLVLDMRNFNQMKVDKERKILTVQSGATWKEVQKFLDAQGLAVKAMQSINIFTIGGTLSVNAHGIAHDPGIVTPTVKSMRVMLPNGEIKTASLEENPELFRLVLGGYGLFGVILDADLEVVDNEIYTLKTDYLLPQDFPQYYRDHIENNDEVGLFYGRLSVSPSSYLREMAVHMYTKTANQDALPPLKSEGNSTLERFVINFSKTGSFGRWLRWVLEKHIEPSIHSCISRNQAMSREEDCIVTRNQEMYDSMEYLKNRLPDTDILQEYFIPQDKMPEFVENLGKIVQTNGANLLNVTVRIVHQDNITALPYAKQDMFAFVLYFNQELNDHDSKILEQTTSDLIDAATSLKGTFYLPYQLYYSKKQLQKAYPEIESFFVAKRKIDPLELFTNKFYEKYGKNLSGRHL